MRRALLWVLLHLRVLIVDIAMWVALLGMLVCPILLALALSGTFATDPSFVVASAVAFVVSILTWWALRRWRRRLVA